MLLLILGVIMVAKVNISLPDEILEKVDEVRKEKQITRSEFIRQASSAYLKLLEEMKEEEKKRKGIEKAILLQDRIRERVGKYDLEVQLHKWRKRLR
jgi:metal-responsive CopG/Arc/MetJ family transcriptional regulator